MKRTYSFLTLLAVIGMSIVFGMVAGGFLNRPRIMYAAGGHSLQSQSPPVTDHLPTLQAAPRPDFADIAEAASRAVVNVTNTRKRKGTGPHSRSWLDYWLNRGEKPKEEEPEDEPAPRNMPPAVTSGSGFLISETAIFSPTTTWWKRRTG